jgi:hypothetical protein
MYAAPVREARLRQHFPNAYRNGYYVPLDDRIAPPKKPQARDAAVTRLFNILHFDPCRRSRYLSSEYSMMRPGIGMGVAMKKQILPLIGMVLLSSPVPAQQQTLEVIPIENFVNDVVNGIYGWSPNTQGDALLNLAEYQYFTDPNNPAVATGSPTFEDLLMNDLYVVNNYWNQSTEVSGGASLLSYGDGEDDGPALEAVYMQRQMQGQNLISAAPEINPASAVGALTLLLGGLLVTRGRRLTTHGIY